MADNEHRRPRPAAPGGPGRQHPPAQAPARSSAQGGAPLDLSNLHTARLDGGEGAPAHRRRRSSRARRAAARRRKRVLALTVLALLLCLGVGAAVGLPRLAAGRQTSMAADSVPLPSATPQAEAAFTLFPTATPAPTEVPEPTAVPGQNAQPKDAAAWQTNADAFWEALTQQPDYAALDLTVREGYPYLVAVNRAASCVTVYAAGEDGRYSAPFQAMVCSGGEDTPLGFWQTPISYQWRLLSGPCYGQYATRIWDSYLFHSVPYYTQHKDDLEYDEFNLLGTPASLGCIRLMAADVKWIYDNCPIGTTVVIYDDADDPGPMGKPGTYWIDPADETLRGWDPTDPDPVNPWPELYRDGTAIRSEAAQALWEEAKADGRWKGSINPTDLQGYSTDSSVEGTRG